MLNLLGTGISAAINTALEDRREKRQLKNQEKLMGIQYQNQQGLNKQGHELQYDMWKKTNYPAQMEMLKEAGLSPGLIYGMGGAGGATTGGQGGGAAAGGNATKGQSMDIAQTAIMQAQKELLKAQTEKTKTETENIGEGGVTRELESAKGEGQKLENAIQKLRNEFEEDTKLTERQKKREERNLLNESRILFSEWRKANAEANVAEVEDLFSTESYDDRLATVTAMKIGQEIKNEWDKSGIAANDTTAKQAYIVMKGQGMKDEDIALALGVAGVAGEIIKTLVPVHIADKVIKSKSGVQK